MVEEKIKNEQSEDTGIYHWAHDKTREEKRNTTRRKINPKKMSDTNP